MSRIIFTDLDGTLLNSQHQVSPGNKAALADWLDSGRQVVISTGRPLPSAWLLAEELQLTKEGCYLIASNGALLYDCFHKQVLFEQGIARADVRYLLDEATACGLHVHSYSKTHILSERETSELAYYREAIHTPSLIVPNITEYLSYDPWKVIMINIEEPEKLHAFQEAHLDWEQGRVSSLFSFPFMLEYSPLGVSKGNAVNALCSLLHIPLQEAIAAGDAENDISMIQAAGIGVAMSNAMECVKETADYVTTASNDEDGFAEILRKFA